MRDIQTGCFKDCTDRSPTCHATCERYQAYVEERTKLNAERYRQAEVHHAIGRLPHTAWQGNRYS